MRQSLILAICSSVVTGGPQWRDGPGRGGAARPRHRIVDGKGRAGGAARGLVRQRGVGERPAAAAPSRRDRLSAHRRDGDERGPLLHELPDVRGRRGAGQYLDDGWHWLDDNIAWAKRHGVYLILNMHVPPGGFQSLGAGKALWDRPPLQDRLIALWTRDREPLQGGADGRRLRSPQRAGGDERPRASGAISPAASRSRSARSTRPHALRGAPECDRRATGRKTRTATSSGIADPNTVYEFHFYKPFHFTHQSASWVPFAAENVRYPDARAEVEWFLLDRKAGTEASPKLPPGDSAWTFYPGAPFRGRRSGDRHRQAGAGRQGERGQGLVRRPRRWRSWTTPARSSA